MKKLTMRHHLEFVAVSFNLFFCHWITDSSLFFIRDVFVYLFCFCLGYWESSSLKSTNRRKTTHCRWCVTKKLVGWFELHVVFYHPENDNWDKDTWWVCLCFTMDMDGGGISTTHLSRCCYFVFVWWMHNAPVPVSWFSWGWYGLKMFYLVNLESQINMKNSCGSLYFADVGLTKRRWINKSMWILHHRYP